MAAINPSFHAAETKLDSSGTSGRRSSVRPLNGWTLRAVVCVGSVAFAFLLYRLVIHVAGSFPPYLPFVAAVLIVSLLTDVWTGIAATLLSAFVIAFWGLAPVGTLHISRPADMVALVLFCGLGAAIALLSELYHRRLAQLSTQQVDEALTQERTHSADQAALLKELEQQREKLRQRELRFTNIANFVPQLVWMCAADGNNIYCNQRWVEYTGLSLEESRGDGWSRPFHPEDRPAAQTAWKNAVNTGETYEVESRLRAADGSYRWFLMRGMSLHNPDGVIERWFGTCTDIQDLKEAQEELRLISDRFRLVLNSSPITVFNQDLDLRITWVYNPTPGYDPAVMIGRRDSEFLERREDAVAIEAIKMEAIRSGQTQRGEVVARLNGVDHFYDLLVEPLRDASGRITGITCAAIDITDRKQAQTAVMRAEKLASIGRFASSMAHEINNPLEAVTNILYLARTNAGNSDLVREYLEMAESELKRVAHVTRQTLGFYRESRLPVTVSADSVLDSALDLLHGKIAARQAKISRKSSADILFHGVPGELRQLISNLLANSLDAISTGGLVSIRLTQTMRNGTPHLRIVLADNGCGIDAASAKCIFEPLFTTKIATGSGLGLWVARQIVEKHRGVIVFRTSTAGPRRGTTFAVTLPLDLN